ncbi:MAG: hypothetical protein V4592_15130 [Bacteroidota bacterium]
MIKRYDLDAGNYKCYKMVQRMAINIEKGFLKCEVVQKGKFNIAPPNGTLEWAVIIIKTAIIV